ncbi:glycoside hydrolase superfamily [Xylariomycetidae sp. FL2044]|nr:glycoside hydrolase superfamily [Xylariomycetidae sp. FL2044]
MASLRFLGVLTAFLSVAGASGSSLAPRAAWPNGPFTTSGRWITDADGAHVTYVGVNWPGSLDTMVPEGLQYQSIADIVSKTKSLGMNTIRLTYATELVDQYYDNGEADITLQDAFTDALGDSAASVLDDIFTHNPSFNQSTTRLQVYDAIAAECATQEIYVHLDNHISQAGWCCSPLDGNSWWGDEFFNVDNWTRGLSFMAEHGKGWPNLMSMSLRNELRIPLTDPALARSSYNWASWYEHVIQGSDAIQAANPDVLVFLSGLDSDKDLSAVVNGSSALDGPGGAFNRDDFTDGAKLVLELHAYDNIFGAGPSDCAAVSDGLLDAGFDAQSNDATNQFPVVLSEFGIDQSQGASDPYVACILDFLPAQAAGWMIWSLGGSYYIREGTADYDEPW